MDDLVALEEHSSVIPVSYTHLEGLAAVKSYAANFKEQVKSLLAQRVENYKSDVESLTGTAPLELADNGDHFSYPGVIDGERDELPL